MKTLRKITSLLLSLLMVVSVISPTVFAEDSVYSITNGYLTYAFNAATGGFSIETVEGNPKKVLDNDMPLLYREDADRSNGTSFITVRIDGKDYVFGQDYGFFKINSSLGTPVVSDEGRLLTVPWTIDGVTVTLKVALGTDATTSANTLGNAGIGFDVENKSGKARDVSVRLMLDTSLGNDIDAPYFVLGESIRPTLTESEFTGADVPSQIRCVDSLSTPKRLSYILMQDWNGGKTPSKVILGHWANLANTRYEYTPDSFCDFTNYSNKYKTPDSAAALYWECGSLADGGAYGAEVLYGVGNFSENEGNIGLNITSERVTLADDGKSYKNDGLIKLTVDIDNTVDGAVKLTAAQLNLNFDDTQFELVDGDTTTMIAEIATEVVTKEFRLRAKPQTDLTAGTVYVSLIATANKENGDQETVETAAERSIILPSTAGALSAVSMTAINPKTVYITGDRAITVSGSMKPFSALAGSELWDLYLVHTTSDHEVKIDKKNIAFLDENYTNMSFSTNETLEVGIYNIVFRFTDTQLAAVFGKTLKAAVTLEVSADEKYKQMSYGILALVRIDDDYDFFTFADEGEYLGFYKGTVSKKGEYRGNDLKFNFGENEDAIQQNEILLTMRGNFKQMTREDGSKAKYFLAKKDDGDIIINNILSYEGEKPLEVFMEQDSLVGKDSFRVKGDGLLKVVNSVNVWRSKWSFTVRKGFKYTLDSERLGTGVKGTDLTLSLDGAACMIQSVGGFLIDMKYGVMSSNWNDDSPIGMVNYGIGFGGKMSLPIKAPKKNEQSLTADQEDLSEELNNLFDESLTADQDDISGSMNDMFTTGELGSSAQTTSTGEKLKKDTNLSEGSLSVEIEDVLFGEKLGDDNVTVEDTGFIGINTTVELALPKDLLGSLVSNAPGIYASVSINTIDKEYEIHAGLNIKVIECEGILAFKEVNVKNKDVILPDKIEFYIRNGLKIPLAPPVLFMTGLGGGINGLADTIGGEFDKLPPITLLLFTRLEAIETLVGDFNAKISLEGLSLTGDMKLKAAKGVLDLKAGISAHWIDPWELNLYGKVSIVDGLIQGGITVTIADNYFYGYIYAGIFIPDSIPLVGGKELAGVEAAVSNKFVGANIKILGIRFGVIYYWGEGVSFGKNIDLSAPSRDDEDEDTFSLASYDSDAVIGYYGTNIHALNAVKVETGAVMLFDDDVVSKAVIDVKNAYGQDALLLEVPYSGTGVPTADDIYVINPDNVVIKAVAPANADDEGGNFLVQTREGKNYIYFTVTGENKPLIKNGKWTVCGKAANVVFDSFTMCGVDDIPELQSGSLTHVSEDSFGIMANWTTTSEGDGECTLDVYLTEETDESVILENLKKSDIEDGALGTNILHLDNAARKSGSAAITLPESFPSGEYRAIIMMSSTEGVSTAVTDSITFKNPNLPKPVKSVKVAYGGNGNILVIPEDADSADYTHYLAVIADENGNEISETFGQFEIGENFVFGDGAGLTAGKKYKVKVKTLREVYTEAASGSNEDAQRTYFYGDDTVESEVFTMWETKKPKLLEVKTNIDSTREFIDTDNVIVEYTFDTPVFMELNFRGQKVYTTPEKTDGDSETSNGKWFRSHWRFNLENLEDGDYVIGFKAYAPNKDTVTDSEALEYMSDSQIGFTIDTSAPTLSLAMRSGESMDNGAAVLLGASLVFADKDGNYTISGLTEPSAVLAANGSADGLTVNSDGSFTYKGKLGVSENSKEVVFTATDKSENKASVTAYVLREGSYSFESIEILSGGRSISKNADGDKALSTGVGKEIELTAVGVTSDGAKVPLGDEFEVEWSLLYGKNIVSLDGGKVKGIDVGEAAVKVKLASGTAEFEDGTRASAGLTDYVIVTVDKSTKNGLAEKIDEAQKILDSTPGASAKKKEALKNAIEDAKKVLNDPTSDDDDYTKAVKKLDEAISDFKKTGTSTGRVPGTIGGGGIEYAAVSVRVEGKGKAMLSATKVPRGTSVTVTAVPEDGYAVSNVIVNGVTVGNNEVTTIKSVVKDTQIVVVFKERASADGLPFTDVKKDDWFYENVKYVYEKGLFNGVSETLFAPQNKVTRAMLVTVLYRAEGTPEVKGMSHFEDVPANAYYAKAVAWAAENGIVKGVSDVLFAPDRNITREQIAAILYRYAKAKGYDMTVGENTNILSYDDISEVSEYAVEALQWTCGTGIMKGRTASTLNPRDNATRAETATVLKRLLELAK